MGLPRAIKAHAENLLVEAEIHYRRAYDQGKANEVLFQNFGALLKKIGKTDEACVIFEEGLKKYPNHAGIKRNYANQLRKNRPLYAIEMYISAIYSTLLAPIQTDLFFSCCDDLVETLREQNFLQWSRLLIATLLSSQTPSPVVLKNLLLIFDRLDVSDESKSAVLSAIELQKDAVSLMDAVSLDFALASHYLSQTQHQRSLCHFEDGIARVNSAPSIDKVDQFALQELIDSNSWNFACALLPLNQFDRGWKLFDHGLRTPADGHQKWQRALLKPFSADELPPWRGQTFQNQRLLLLEEQGIGDCMMFLTLIPALLAETKFIGLFISPRLVSIYKRSFSEDISSGKISIYTKHDLPNNRLKSSNYDAQIPLGSICQYRFTSIDSYAPRVPILLADPLLSKQLRLEYMKTKPSAKRLVGVSWRGGGRGIRIKQKSIDVDLFAKLMLQHPDICFVDLQYGETKEQIDNWKELGVDIIHDRRIDPLKDMNRWLAQVNACDAVVSVANTTIHGAGGLNIPTQCLLSTYSDWRWFVNPEVKRSYWYPSVGIARESSDPDVAWSDAYQVVSDWLHSGCPMPLGPTHVPV